MTDIVLRQGMAIDLHLRKNRFGADLQQGSDLSMNQAGQFLRRQFRGNWIGRASDKTGQQDFAFRRSVWEQRGIPDRAQHLQTTGSRHKKPKARERVQNILTTVYQGDDCNWRVLDSRQYRLERRVHVAQQCSGNIRGRRYDQVLRENGFLATS